MCGRVTITVSKEELNNYLFDHFSITNFDMDKFKPSYNISPSQNVLSVINDGINFRAGFLKWGFIPDYSKDEKSTIMINTRSETIDTRPTFKNSFLNKRCIILVDSFYEWKKEKDNKSPIRIMMKDHSIFALAGIWNAFVKEDKTKIFTFSIITTTANKLITQIHQRMPVILGQEKIKIWLDPNNRDPKYLKSLLLPFDENKMMAYIVSSEVNNPRNDYPSLIKENT